MFSTHKKIYGIITVFILLFIVICAVFLLNKTLTPKPAAEETKAALERGETILRETFPDYFSHYENVRFEAELENDIWEIRNADIGDRIVDVDDGWVVTAGGGVYVRFNRKTGKIIKIGVND